MDDFIEERVNLVRQLADIADPFTGIRLLKLAEICDQKLRPPLEAVHQTPSRFSYWDNLPRENCRLGQCNCCFRLRQTGTLNAVPLRKESADAGSRDRMDS